MAVHRIERMVLVSTEYACDMLFKPIKENEVYRTYRKNCISKEAVRRLPPIFSTNDDLLEVCFRASGHKELEFQPEWLYTGIWLLYAKEDVYDDFSHCTMTCSPDTEYVCDPANDRSKFQSVQEVEDRARTLYISQSVGYNFWILQNGELVRHLQVVKRIEIISLLEPVEPITEQTNSGDFFRTVMGIGN